MIAELQTVALTRDDPEHGLVAGDIGTVVHVYPNQDAAEVEFVRADGLTVAVLTLRAAEFRPLKADMLHARRLAS
jgi:ATP-dependent exoDNAse (exonuclease V) alpha subunit